MRGFIRGVNINKNHIRLLLVALLFGCIGAYFVFAAKASPSEPWRDCCMLSGGNATTAYSNNPGDVINLPISLVMPASNPGTSWKTHVEVLSDPSFVEYMGYDCGDGIVCTPSPYEHFVATPGFNKQLAICLSLPINHSQATVKIFTLKFKIKKVGSSLVPVGLASHPTTCNSVSDPLKHSTGWAPGLNANGTTEAGTKTAGSTASGGAHEGSSDGSTGSSKERGSGNSANKQSNNSNRLPSSSVQGDTKNPELQPSPFFDGKEFQPGSDSDTLGGTVSSTGKQIVRNWLLVVGVILLGGVTGYGVWQYRLHKKTK